MLKLQEDEISKEQMNDPLRLAQDPNTSEAELEFLAAYQGPDVRRAIAVHPNTSLRALLSLLVEFPVDVLKNPKLLRALESEPDIPLRDYAAGYLRLLEVPLSLEIRQTIFSFIERLNAKRLLDAAHGALLFGQFDAQDSGLYSRMLQHPECPQERIEAAILGAVPEHRRAAALNPLAPRALLQQLIALGSSEDLTTRTGTYQQSLSHESLMRLSRLGFWPQYLLAASPDAPLKVLESLAQSPFSEIRLLIARNESTPEELLRALSSDGDTMILGSIASNPNTPPDCLRMLREKNSSSLRVKSCLAQNPRTPDDVLLKLSGDSSVRQHLIKRQHLPEAAVQQLMKTLTKRDLALWKELAAGQYLTDKLAMLLYQKRSRDLKQGLAGNPVCAPEVLSLLARESDADICARVARNLNTPTSILRELNVSRTHPNLRSFPSLVGDLLSFGRELFVAHQEAGVSLDALAQRALMTFEAAAPQGFSENAWPVFSSLSAPLLAQPHPLLQYLGLLAKSVSQPPDGAPLGSMHAKAVAALVLLGLPTTSATARATQAMGLRFLS